MDMIQSAFIATAVQEPPIFLDLAKSVEKACDLIAEAARQGAGLIVFPETWLTGYPLWFDLVPGAALWGSQDANQVYQRLFENSPSLSDPAIQVLGKAAKSASAIIVMGLHERAGSTLYNTTLYIGADGQVMGYHFPSRRHRIRESASRRAGTRDPDPSAGALTKVLLCLAEIAGVVSGVRCRREKAVAGPALQENQPRSCS